MTRADPQRRARPGIAYMAVSAVDVALWDLKARLARAAARAAARPLPRVGAGLRQRRLHVLQRQRLREQLAGWVEQGIPRVKMKVGSEPRRATRNASRCARDAIGDGRRAVRRRQRRLYAQAGARAGRALPSTRRACRGSRSPSPRTTSRACGSCVTARPAGMEIAAGEYGYELGVLRAHARGRRRSAGRRHPLRRVTAACSRVDALCSARSLPLSGHCAPSLHAHALCACERTVHLEYFHDHARIEGCCSTACSTPDEGALHARPARPGLGLELKRADAERCAA